jgi:hypothetical protein
VLVGSSHVTAVLFSLEGKPVVVFTIFEVMSLWNLSLNYLNEEDQGENYFEFLYRKSILSKAEKGRYSAFAYCRIQG